MKISSNIAALMTNANLNKANMNANKAMERLSSGLKINSAKDNPAGLAIARKLDMQAEGLNQANDNAMNGIALIQTAEGALEEVHSVLNRIRELAVQGQNGVLTESEQKNIQTEIDSLLEEIKTTAEQTEFNKMNILNINHDITVQIGANANQTMDIKGSNINLKEVSDEIKGLSLKDNDILEKVDKAIQSTSEIRGNLGAYQNRLEHVISNLGVGYENTTASLSRIQDADMAEEMTNYTQFNVISQAGIAMLAQANQRPQQVLQLLNS